MQKIRLRGDRHSLSRETDGIGDAGTLESIDIITLQHYKNEIRVGCIIRCGSSYARTMSYQDYWQTTVVKEILEVSENGAKFRTSNSIYIVRGC